MIKDKTETIKYANGEIDGYLAYPNKDKTSAVIVIHEIWGLNDQTKGVARRLAEEGYLSLAPDLMKGVMNEVITPSILSAATDPETRNEAQKKLREATAPTNTPEFAAMTIEKLKACFTFLKNHPNGNGKVAVIGFCFGGTYAYELAGNEPELKCAIPFYGRQPADETIAKIHCPVRAFYGENDERLIKTLPELISVMKNHKKDFEYTVYKGVGHAFFNEQNAMMYNAEAAELAWKKVKEYLSETL